VSEVAAASGFYDYNYFTRMFKKKYGVSPREFNSAQ
jgi:two-component system response regulator YesN